MAENLIDCRYCGGPRPCNETHCLGCAMPIDNAKKLAPRPLPLECPRCGSQHRRDLQYHHMQCLQCGTEYEKPDFELIEATPPADSQQ